MIDVIIAQMLHHHHHQHQQQQQEQPPLSPLPHEQQQELQPIPLPTITVDRFSTLQYFWHLFQWSAFISTDLFMHLSELFIQNIRLNCTFVAYGIAKAAITPTALLPITKTTKTQPIKPNNNNNNAVNAVKASSFCSQPELFIKNDADNDYFNDNIDAEMNLDHVLFCRNAANQQTIIQTKQTDQL